MNDRTVALDRKPAGADPELAAAFARCLTPLKKLIVELNEFDELSDVLNLVAETAATIVRCDGALVLQMNSPRELRAVGSFGLSQEYVDAVTIPVRQGRRPAERGSVYYAQYTPVKTAWETGRPGLVPDIEREPRLRYWLPQARREGIRSFSSFPLRSHGHNLGVLNIYHHRAHEFSGLDLELLSAIADIAAAAVQTAALRQNEQHQVLQVQHLHEQRDLIDRAHSVLMRIVLYRQGIEVLADALRDLLSAVVLIEDTEGRLLAAASRDGTRRDVRRLIATARSHDRPATPDETGAAEPSSSGSGGQHVPVVLDGRQLATIWLATDPATDPAVVRWVMQDAAVVVALTAAGDLAHGQSRQREESDLLTALRGADTEAAQTKVIERGARLGYDFAGAQFAVVVDGGDRDELSAREHSLRVQAALASIPGAFVGRSAAMICALVPVSDGLDDAEIISRIVGAQAGAPPRRTVILGRSERLAQLVGDLGFGEYLLRSNVAAAAGSDHIVDARGLGLYRMLMQVADPVQLRSLRRSTIGALLDYDRDHRTHLLDTVAAYLRNNLRAGETAAELAVHVNTLAYRLRRVEQILGVELKSTADLLNLQFGLHLHQVLGERGVD